MTQQGPRVAVIGVFHETNTYSPVPTDLAAFERRGLLRGPAWVREFAGTRTVGGGFLAGGESAGLDLVGVFGAYATPAGLITKDAIETILTGIEEELDRAGVVDGVLLELHGALVAEGYDDAEQTIVNLLRQRLGRTPIIAVTDLHANLRTARLAELDGLIGYRTNPHVDTFERGRDAAMIMGRVLREGLTLTRATADSPAGRSRPRRRRPTDHCGRSSTGPAPSRRSTGCSTSPCMPATPTPTYRTSASGSRPPRTPDTRSWPGPPWPTWPSSPSR